jgi:hypothetical protein
MLDAMLDCKLRAGGGWRIPRLEQESFNGHKGLG